MSTAAHYAPGSPLISEFMDVDSIFEQYFNDGSSVTENESKGSVSVLTTPPSDPSSTYSLGTTDSSPPSTSRSVNASPQMFELPSFDESQIENLWDDYQLDFRTSITQGEEPQIIFPTEAAVSVSGITPMQSVTSLPSMGTIQPNQVNSQASQFFVHPKFEPDKATVHSPLATLVHGYHPSNTQAVHGQVTPVEDSQRSAPVFPPDIFKNSRFASSGGMHSPPQSRRGSDSPPQPPNTRRSRKNSKTSKEIDEASAQEAKRRRFLERNRVAASKCRQKKKEWMQNLEETARTAQHNSKFLQAAVGQLKDELLMLKQELLKHHDCDCAKIRTYLMQEAEKVVEQQRKGNIPETQTLTKQRQLSIAESEISEVNALGEELDILANETLDDTSELTC